MVLKEKDTFQMSENVTLNLVIDYSFRWYSDTCTVLDTFQMSENVTLPSDLHN